MSRRKRQDKAAESRCPSCNTVLDESSGISDAKAPREGDVSICIYCGAILVFGPKLVLRPPTAAELDGLKQSSSWETVKRARLAAQSLGVERKTKRDGAGPN